MLFYFFLSWVSKPKKVRNKKKSIKEKAIFFSTISMGKEGKTEVGDEDGERVEKNPEQICPYFFGILFNSFPN